MVSKILSGYEEASWPKQLEISHVSQILTNDCQILVLSNSYLITTVTASALLFYAEFLDIGLIGTKLGPRYVLVNN